LRPSVTIGVQAAPFYPQHTATPAKLAGASIRVPSVQVARITDGLFFTIRHPERGRAGNFFSPHASAEPESKDLLLYPYD
jgi:hypothetical protein